CLSCLIRILTVADVLLSYIVLNFIHMNFFFNFNETDEINTLSLHDALPISLEQRLHKSREFIVQAAFAEIANDGRERARDHRSRSEEHTSELQSPDHLVCRLLLEKKKKKYLTRTSSIYISTNSYLAIRL